MKIYRGGTQKLLLFGVVFFLAWAIGSFGHQSGIWIGFAVCAVLCLVVFALLYFRIRKIAWQGPCLTISEGKRSLVVRKEDVFDVTEDEDDITIRTASGEVHFSYSDFADEAEMQSFLRWLGQR